jgi:hypothetical protein
MPRVTGQALALCLIAASIATRGDETVRLVPLADAAFAGSSVNVVANARQPAFTHERTQYAGYYDADGFMVLARRAVGAAHWDTMQTRHKGNVADAHNSISLVVDGAGVLHVAWDHHGQPLNYARGVAPGSTELGPRQPMTGTSEDRVTYPQFYRLPSGDLLFLYRDGASGRGKLVLNRYSLGSGAWTTVQPSLIDGEGVRSPYWDMVVDTRGTLHLAWIWRESPDVATNHDICYARSADRGRTWMRSDGSPLRLPLTADSAEYAAHIPQNSNLMNSPTMTADDQGRPFITTYWSPSPGAAPRFHVLRHDGKAWQVIEGPARTTTFTLAGGGTKAPPISRAVLVVESSRPSSPMHLLYRDSATEGHGGVTVATRNGSGTWTVRPLTSDPLGAWEPAIDPSAWERFGQVQMLVQRVAQRDGNDREVVTTPPTRISMLTWSPTSGRKRPLQEP